MPNVEIKVKTKKNFIIINFQLVQEGILEYLTAECSDTNKGALGGVPKDCVNCCRPLMANGHDWVRLLFCGHDVCDNCFLDHVSARKMECGGF